MKSKALAIPKESSMPTLSLICSFLMFLTFFFYFQSINGQVQTGITTPVAAFNNDIFILFFNIVSSSIPVVLFIVTICFAKRRLEKILIPTAMMPITYLLYGIYSMAHNGSSFVLNDWMRVSISILILLLCYFMFKQPIIKKKWPLILVCCTGIVASVLCVIFKWYPFAYHYDVNVLVGDDIYTNPTIVYQSALIQYCSYLGAILFLAIGLTNGGEYKPRSSRKFFLMKHMDQIHAINVAHREKK